jgi:hypothetical protein
MMIVQCLDLKSIKLLLLLLLLEASYQVSVHLAKRFQRRRFFLEISHLETRIACGGHVCFRIGTKLTIFIEDLP